MANEASEVRSFGDGHVCIGNAMETFPANIGAGIDSNKFAKFGYIDEKGPRFSFGREKKDVPAWQTLDPVRSIVTGIPKSVTFTLLQWNRQTIRLAFGGGNWTSDGAGMFRYQPPDPDDTDERSLLIEGVDGDFVYRFCFPRTEIMNAVEFAFVHDDATGLEVEMKVLTPTDGSKPFFILTNDTNVSPTGVAS